MNSCTEVRCTYEREVYSVRDTGEVMRHPRDGRRRRLDGQWTFGNPNASTGYMDIAAVRVHRIVATAFHGVPPTPRHVVDHIDTNRRNNRPENLRWVTRLENALLNPITAKRIVLLYGSIEAFLADPSRPREGPFNSNFEWMRTVSAEEAQTSLERLLAWAGSERPSSGGSLGEWLFSRNVMQGDLAKAVDQDALVTATTLGAAQRNWRVPSEFPCCPTSPSDNPIASYAANLAPGADFARNESFMSVVLAVATSDDHRNLWVLARQGEDSIALKPWGVAQITFENGVFVHTSLGTYFSREGAEKQFCLAQGLEWTGGETFDDFC